MFKPFAKLEPVPLLESDVLPPDEWVVVRVCVRGYEGPPPINLKTLLLVWLIKYHSRPCNQEKHSMEGTAMKNMLILVLATTDFLVNYSHINYQKQNCEVYSSITESKP